MLKKLLVNFIFFLLISCSGVELVNNFEPKQNIVVAPGELLAIDVSPRASLVICDKEKMNPFHAKDRSYFVFAESYFSKRKNVTCKTFKGKTELYQQHISISKKVYPYETLSVNPKRVKLNDKDLKRVIRERKILKKIYSSSEKKLLIEKDFSIPLNSKVTSAYGTRRLFNNVRKSQHLGIDYRAKVGVPIPSSNKGKVVLAQNLFYTGNTVIVDHGLGVFTLYGHLNKILVKKGDLINRRQILGEAGKTGRVTGPHLHWGVKVNGHWVNGDVLTQLNLP